MIAALFIATTLAAPADVRAADRERAFELVQKLSDTSFKVREKASDDLVKLGAAAVDALRKGLTHTDTEVSERCRKLLPQALDFHLQEQIDRFLAKPDGPIPEELPGLKRWIKATGTTKDSRELYAEMVKEQRRVLVDVEAAPDQAHQKFQTFCAEVYNRNRLGTVNARANGISRSEMLLFFFLGSDPNCRKGSSPTGAVSSIQATQFLNGTQVTDLIAGNGASPAFQKIFIAWLEQERYSTLVRRGFQLAAQANLKDAAPIAVTIALEKNGIPSARAYAILSAAKLFGPEHLKSLEPLMEDKTVISRIGVANGDQMSTEMRDIGLGIAVQATGQKMADYGFDRFRELPVAAATTSYTYYAQTEKKREEAFQKWKEWAAKNKK